MRHDRRNSPPRPIAFCNAGGRRGALPSDLRCNFFRLLYGAFTGARRVNCLRAPSIDRLKLRRTCSFFAVVMAIAFAIYVPPFIACPSLVAFEMCFARSHSATEGAEEAASLRIKISSGLMKLPAV